MDGATLHGCGGDPASLLIGKSWVVQRISGVPLADRSRVTLNFGADGRVSGNSSCNSYSGRYTLSGEGLTIGQTAGTMMACIAAAMMTQEKAFLDVLRGVQRFDVRSDGTLVLHTSDTRTIEAREQPAPRP